MMEKAAEHKATNLGCTKHLRFPFFQKQTTKKRLRDEGPPSFFRRFLRSF